MSHAWTNEGGLGNDAGALGNAFGTVEREDAISLDRAIEGIKDQPRRGRVAADNHSRYAIDGGEATLELVKIYGLHDAIVPEAIAHRHSRRKEDPQASADVQ
jgi:hypothetical protein